MGVNHTTLSSEKRSNGPTFAAFLNKRGAANRGEASGQPGPLTTHVVATGDGSPVLNPDRPHLPWEEAALAGAMQDVLLQVLAAHGHGAFLV